MATGNGAQRSDRISPRFGPVASLRCAPGCHSYKLSDLPNRAGMSNLGYSPAHFLFLNVGSSVGNEGVPKGRIRKHSLQAG